MSASAAAAAAAAAAAGRPAAALELQSSSGMIRTMHIYASYEFLGAQQALTVLKTSLAMHACIHALSYLAAATLQHHCSSHASLSSQSPHSPS
jgi:hypothetical protein